MELVLKTSDSERSRGFESHPFRQISFLPGYEFCNVGFSFCITARSGTQVAQEGGLLNR